MGEASVTVQVQAQLNTDWRHTAEHQLCVSAWAPPDRGRRIEPMIAGAASGAGESSCG
jgi:hypothetical protein